MRYANYLKSMETLVLGLVKRYGNKSNAEYVCNILSSLFIQVLITFVFIGAFGTFYRITKFNLGFREQYG